LEGAAALLAQALIATGTLAVRLRQIERRAPGLIGLLEPADRELALIVDACDRAQELIGGVLAKGQAERSKK
jgi:hypothetical protein